MSHREREGGRERERASERERARARTRARARERGDLIDGRATRRTRRELLFDHRHIISARLLRSWVELPLQSLANEQSAPCISRCLLGWYTSVGLFWGGTGPICGSYRALSKHLQLLADAELAPRPLDAGLLRIDLKGMYQYRGCQRVARVDTSVAKLLCASTLGLPKCRVCQY